MEREVELDRWREAGKSVGHKLGVVEERNRIIGLLLDVELSEPRPTISFLISLIKGEVE